MMIEHLLICPCDISINNQYWDSFDCSIPFKQNGSMCKKPKKSKNSLQFQDMNGLMKHLKNQKCKHHIIVHKYLSYYLHLKKKQSHLSNQLKDVAKHKSVCYHSEKNTSLQSNNVKNVTTYNMKYLLKSSLHHEEMVRYITSIFTIIETKDDWSSGYSGILYCLKTESQCDNNYELFQLRKHMRDRFKDKLFLKMFKASVKNLSKVDGTFLSKGLTTKAINGFKNSIYKEGMESRNYLTKVHKFDDNLWLTVLSLMYPTISFYCYSPLDLDLFIYKFDVETKATIVIRTHIYHKSTDAINIFLIKKSQRIGKQDFFNA